ncbi:spore germination lipoprotein GerD [Bacillaceae bacterium S4-13-56]
MGARIVIVFTTLFFLVFTGCSGNPSGASEEANYEETKKMVVDLLKTDDGKKAIQEVMADEKMQQMLVMDSITVKESIEASLQSDKGKEFWKKLFEDPEFVKTFIKSTEEDQQKMMKDLMNDSEYQAKMLEILQDPQMMEQITKIVKSQEFRSHLEKVVTETFESPVFKAKISDILLKAAEEMQKSGGQGGQSGGGEQGSGGGESGGGEGDGGGGGQ